MSAQPQRIQLSRRKGWRKPPGVISVARPSKWGNPFAVGEWIARDDPLFPYVCTPLASPGVQRAVATLSRVRVPNRAQAVEMHEFWLYQQPHLMLSVEEELTGHDLGCWCPLDGGPCHANTLLALANGWDQIPT